MAVYNFKAIHPVIVEKFWSGPEWWMDQPTDGWLKILYYLFMFHIWYVRGLPWNCTHIKTYLTWLKIKIKHSTKSNIKPKIQMLSYFPFLILVLYAPHEGIGKGGWMSGYWQGEDELFGDPGVATLTSRLLFRLICALKLLPGAISISPPSSTRPSNTAPRLCRILTQNFGQLKAYRIGFNTGFKNANVVATGSPTSTRSRFLCQYWAVTSIMQKMW